MKGTRAPRSYWVDTAALPRFGSLDRSLEVDAVVVGAGITGVTAAFLLRRAGARVALLDRRRVGGVDTGYTTAHLTFVTDARLHQLVKRFGPDRAGLAWEAGQAAIDQIDATVRELGIDCDFQWLPGHLHLPTGPEKRGARRGLERDAELAARLGFKAELIGGAGPFGFGIRFPSQAAFHPLRYLGGILEAIAGPGCQVFERSAVTRIEADPLTVSVGRRKIRCRFLVLATHTPLMGTTSLVKATLFQTKLALYSTYAVGGRVPDDAFPEGLWWDTADPYRHLRITRSPQGRYAILGGGDHKTGQRADPGSRYETLAATLQRTIPGIRIDHRWSGQVIETSDGLPYIGETAENQFVATGFAGNGMTFGTLAAMMARDRFIGEESPWRALFDPRRKPIRAAARYLGENKDFPFYYVRDRLARSEGSSVRAIRRGEGRILNLEGKKVAGYRDDQGRVTLLSPVCTHLGCIVGWNSTEKTWDCPCHGSRFDPAGKVLSGPAEEDLEPAPVRAPAARKSRPRRPARSR